METAVSQPTRTGQKVRVLTGIRHYHRIGEVDQIGPYPKGTLATVRMSTGERVGFDVRELDVVG